MAVSLVLEGRALDLVKTGSDWVARRDAPDILARQQSDGTWVVFDGQGRTYSFTVVATPGNPAAAMWLLKSITGVGGSRIEVDYNITSPTVPGGGGLAIDLTNVSYNPHPTTANCFKNSVALVYDADVAAPLSLSVLGDRILVRKHKLSMVNVNSKATCSDSYVRLRHYELQYPVPDVDTQLPRLQTVQLFGRDGTPEATTPIPVANYGYGTASSGGQLQYAPTGDTASGFIQPYTMTDTSPRGGGIGFSTFASLHDLSGDGMPDLISYVASSQLLTMVRDWLNSTQSVSLGDGMPQTPLETRSLQQARYLGDNNVDRLWRQAIDVNGDGRIDRIDAAEEAGRWVVYLNTPDPADPGHPLWQRRTLSIQQLATQLAARGFSIDPNFVPLAQRRTARRLDTRICWHWNRIDHDWEPHPEGFGTHCSGSPGSHSELTFTEWEVADINGDGYPDVVFNSSPMVTDFTDEPDPDPPPTSDQNLANLWAVTEHTITPRLPDGNKIDAVLTSSGFISAPILSHSHPQPHFVAPIRAGSPSGRESTLPTSRSRVT